MFKEYEKTKWINNETPLNETNLNKIEEGIANATKDAINNKTTIDRLIEDLRSYEIDNVNKHNDITESIEKIENDIDLVENKINNKTYDSLLDKPSIPNKLSQLENDKGYLTEHQDISHKADITYVDEKVNEKFAALVNSAPETLDTLGELAEALTEHEDSYDALLETIANKAYKNDIPVNVSQLNNDAEYVSTNQLKNKIDGKGLSTEDFTTFLKQKLEEGYSKEQINNLLDNLDISNALKDIYTKKEIDTLLNNIQAPEANLNNYYTKDEIISLLESLDNSYDDTEIQNQINAIKLILTTDDIDLDTLQELVNALKNNTASIDDIFTALSKKVEDTNYVHTDNNYTDYDKNKLTDTYTKSQVNTLLTNKVTVVSGKDLSTNDFTNEAKEKLDSLNNYDDTQLKEQINNVKPNYNILVGQETSNKWSGTTIPNDSYVEKVYFNTALTLNETLSILSDLTFVEFNDIEIWACVTDTTMTDYVVILKAEDGYIIQAYHNGGNAVEGFEMLFAYPKRDSNVFNENGWRTGFSGVATFNMKNHLTLVAPTLGFTPENDKASSLFSTTPFEENNSVTTTTLYQLNEDGTLNKNKPIELGVSKQELEETIGNIASILDILNGEV